MAFPRIEIYQRARPLTGDEDFIISQGNVLRKTSTASVVALANAGVTSFGGTPLTLAAGTPVGVGPTGALIACSAANVASLPFVGFFVDGDTNDVRTAGIFTTSGLTAGAAYYIGLLGGITSTAPHTQGCGVQRIGTAVSATELYIQPGIVVISAG